ncbi:CoA transferase [Streptomyces sp. M2CJ-2]|uniref:CaiB/BaiF CoA transferase family protein n=1 Tax=Streptomyces sp. M2CJ-2 TaxID=2803948 RepID=UPI0019263E6E|nr:CaiB/BaiF CoA-transferase family protein [Streptomyces sp. M2CJ-2]MBL3668088.1 CoA transferase [Streptomyces sp. M2CJ-2]
MPEENDEEENARPTGPLAGITVVELAGIGPIPHAGMLLADMGADVICVERAGPPISWVAPTKDVLRRNRRSIVVDLRTPEGLGVVEKLVARADVLLEGHRPGVTERLGIGPERCHELNPALVYGRMTGWGQSGPLASRAGHDIGYVAVTGALTPGPEGTRPFPPANLLGDFGGGATYLVMGVLAALLEAGRSGRGQVVDASIVDGAASLTSILHGLMASDLWTDRRGANRLDGAAPWYDTYGTSDEKFVAVGALEPKFYAELLQVLGLEGKVPDRSDVSAWPAIRSAFAEVFGSEPQSHWTELFMDSDACVAPVLSLTEAREHPHLREREVFIEVGGVSQPAPAPRFSRTPSGTPRAPRERGAHTREILESFGIAEVDELLRDGIVFESSTEATNPEG